MKTDHLDITARIATTLAESDGPRDGCTRIIGDVSRAVSAKIAFAALASDDNSVADLLAAHGIGAADFRRLETRVPKSRLWTIIQLAKPVAVDDARTDRALEHLAFGAGVRFLIAVPISLHGTVKGLLSAGFSSASGVDEEYVIRFLAVAAGMIAQSLRVSEIAGEESRRLAAENVQLNQALREKYDFSHLIGNSSAMRQVYSQVAQVARTNATVLLRGESGTGKELIANAIHYNSLRAKRQFVSVACGARSEGSIDGELFNERRGRFRAADGGTLFLDEILDLPLTAQQRVVSVLRSRPDDGGRPKFNIRLIAGSARDVESAVTDGAFSRELFETIGALTIFLPPLRERKSDILMLAEHFLEKFAAEHKKHILRISTPAIDMLTAYHFPGNVSELENVIERAVIDCDSNVIHGHHLPPTLQTAEMSGTETRLTLTAAVDAFERDLIQDALKSTRGNVAKAARMLDSTERILGYKIKQYGISAKRFKQWKAAR
jgi:Nif-specific regulatory protein